MNKVIDADQQQLLKHSIIVILVLSLFSVIAFTACEPIAPIKIYNETTENLTIFINDEHLGEVIPEGEIKNDFVIIEARFKIEAKNSSGEILYSKEFIIEEMVDMDWKIVIKPS